MHNDSKLGLLAGVAGVVVAAILASKNPAAIPGPIAQASPGTPAATPTHAGPMAKPPIATTTMAARSRPELEGTTASRNSGDEDE